MKGGSKFQIRTLAVGDMLAWLILSVIAVTTANDAYAQLSESTGEILYLDSRNSANTSKNESWWVKPGRIDAFQLDAVTADRNFNLSTLGQQGWAEVRVPGAAENASTVHTEHPSFVYLKRFELTAPQETDLLLSLGQISDRDRTYVNGKLIGQSGIWDAEQPQSYDKPRFYHVPRELIRTNELNTIIVEVRRYFSDASGILQGSVHLGPIDKVMRRFFLMESAQIWVLPCYLMIGVAFFFMYWQRSRQLEYGVFGLFALLLCMYVSLRSPARFVWEFDFIFWKRIEYLLCFSLGSVLYYFFELFLGGKKTQLPFWQRKLGLLCHALTLGILFIILFSGSPLTWFWMFNHIVIYIWAIYSVLAFQMLFSRVILKDTDARWMAVGLGCFLSTVVIDVFKAKDVHAVPVMLVGYGCFALIASIALVLANRFLRVYRQVEYLNTHLEAEVKEQTLELRQAMEAAQAADEVKSQFLANVSHELRTPMNGIVGMRHLLAQTNLSPQQQEYLSTLAVSTQSLRELIDDILDFSSLEKMGQRQQHRDFDPRLLIEQCIHSLGGQVQGSGNTLRREIHSDVPDRVRGDSRRIAQVLRHLIRNAIKFTQQGNVDIKMEIIPSSKASEEGVTAKAVYYASIEVIDTGIGVPSDMLEAIFQPFTQVDSTLTRNYGGMGVGLAICKRLIQNLEGAITVESQEGKGACFRFIIPLHAARDPQSGSEAPGKTDVNDVTDNDENDTRPSILMVEDNEVNLRYLKIIIEKAGYHVVTARNGKEAVSLLKDTTVALVLMDLQMPIMDGLEATRAIRNSERENQIVNPLPIFAITAHGGVEDMRRAMDAGMNAYFVKPIDPDELKLAIKSFLSRSRMTAGS